jgi:inosine-uridine nucleoside N-ribohydrolase
LPVLNDPLAVAIALFPDLAETERVRVEVELRGEQTKGCTVIAADPTGNGEVVKSVDWQRFWALMEQALFSD